jgi:hypothetical protein
MASSGSNGQRGAPRASFPAPEDARAVTLSMLTAALAIADQVAGKSLREGLFLSTFRVTDLPKAMLGAALAAIPATILLSVPMKRFGPARLAPLLFVVSAVLHLLEWAVVPRAPRAAAVLLFLHVSTFGAILTSTFWSIVNERFDPRVLKRLVGRIGASATFGGFAGGAAMERVAHWVDARSALLVVGGMCLFTAAFAWRLGETFVEAPQDAEEARKATTFTGYLWTLALIVACSAAMSTFADVALKQIAAARFASAESLVRFFALFYTSSAVIGFLVQALLSRRLLDTIGIAGTLTIPPFIGLALSLLSISTPSLATVGALRGTDMALGSSLFRSAFEPLFTPLSPAAKRGAKAFIDVAFDKGGDAFASAIMLIAIAVAPALGHRIPLLLSVVASALTLVLSFRARRGYVTELEASLRGGTLNLDATDVDDATTKMTLSVTAFGIDRTRLLEQIARLRQSGIDASDPGRPNADSAEAEELVADVRALLGSDAAAVSAVLTRPSLDLRLAPFVVPHLGRSSASRHAVTALRGMGEGITGVLSDAMAQTKQSAVVRRRIPYVLRGMRGEGVVHALTLALSSDVLDVRYRAALSLRDVTENDKELRPPRRQVYALALREVEKEIPSSAVVDHVFALLSLCTPRQSVELVRQGLASENKKLRGIALEYLESLLPDAVRVELVPRLDPAALPRPESVRNHDQLWNELKTSLKNEPPSRRPESEDDVLEAMDGTDTMPPEEPK